MKKYIFLIVIIIILVGGGFLFYFLNNNKNNKPNNYNTSKSGSNISLDYNVNTSKNNNSSNSTYVKPPTFVEQDVASYSTVIKNKVDTNRQHNISLTCSSLNGVEIKPSDTFSFCDTVGKATTDRGYL